MAITKKEYSDLKKEIDEIKASVDEIKGAIIGNKEFGQEGLMWLKDTKRILRVIESLSKN